MKLELGKEEFKTKKKSKTTIEYFIRYNCNIGSIELVSIITTKNIRSNIVINAVVRYPFKLFKVKKSLTDLENSIKKLLELENDLCSYYVDYVDIDEIAEIIANKIYHTFKFFEHLLDALKTSARVNKELYELYDLPYTDVFDFISF